MSYKVMMQYFEWYLNSTPHLWQLVKEDAKHLHDIGIDALWLPPAYKGIGGKNEVGYAVYDLYDLGEFDQQGTIPTKYGTKDEYIDAIDTLHAYHIDVYGDVVLNHKMGGDANELVKAYEVNQNKRNEVVSSEELIKVPTIFTFPQRHDKYSHFHWDHKCFNGFDYDILSKRHATFLFKDKNWQSDVDDENGNFDYLMGANIDFSSIYVVSELKRWGQWYLDFTNIDGLRLDALKHISARFFDEWIPYLREYKQQNFFSVGEFWHGDVTKLLNYLDEVHDQFSLFDVPLHYRFYDACQKENYDMSKILDNTLVKCKSSNAVTFVDNHDTQPSQGLQSWIDDWFKPLAYALILLRIDGYPCVFYGDYYGIKHNHIQSKSEMLDKLLYLRKHYLTSQQVDYFDDPHIIGWVNDKMVCIMSHNESGNKKMLVDKKYAGKVFFDFMGNNQEVIIDENGFGDFKVNGKSLSVYVLKGDQDVE